MKRLITLLSILFFLASCGGFGGSGENEPNDSFSKASPIRLNSTVQGYVDSAEDIDVFSYECKKTESVSISLSALKGINHDISIFAGKGARPLLVKRIDDARKSSPEFFPSLTLTPGKWFFVVGHGDRDKPAGNREKKYRFQISKLRGESEREPNDSAETASPLIPGTPIEGFYSQSFNKQNKDPKARFIEYDYFSCDSSEGGTMADIEVSGVPGVDSAIEIISGTGRVLVRTDAAGMGAPERISGQGIRANGRFYIRLFAKNYGVNYKEPYTLQIMLKGYEEGVELEPNNVVDESTLLVSTMKGAIQPENDADVYRIDPLPDAVLRTVTVMPSPGLDITLSVLDKDSVVLAEINGGGAGSAETYAGVRVGTPVYIALRGSVKDDAEEQYYHIRAGIASEQNNSENEPNDTKEQAGILSGDVNGYLSYKGDKDFYLFEKPGRTEVEITLAHNSGDTSTLSVTDNMGYIIRTVETENGSVILNEFVNDRLFIIVETTSQGSEQPYRLTIVPK